VTSALGNPARTAKLEQMLANLALEHAVPYIGIGNEIDNETPYVEVAALVSHLADVIHDLHTGTLVFTVFQYDHLLGLPNPADYVASVPSVDFVGFTSYRFLRFEAVADVPADYFAPIDRWVRTPCAFTELGWPSRRAFPGYPTLHGSESEQVALIHRFWTQLVVGRPVAFASWSALHDLADWREGDPIVEVGHVFESTGLMANTSEPEKPRHRGVDIARLVVAARPTALEPNRSPQCGSPRGRRAARRAHDGEARRAPVQPPRRARGRSRVRRGHQSPLHSFHVVWGDLGRRVLPALIRNPALDARSSTGLVHRVETDQRGLTAPPPYATSARLPVAFGGRNRPRLQEKAASKLGSGGARTA
jgi:hypothetical protein